ncbi:MFS transporter [Desulfuromonas sp. CSMB_57]|uniref:MFS transporter n=1 Tax=Desulfuromonas sp. CSMB_57 TaxID=2807629 RepID=UPI001CD59E93|nr:MFS transporter [Desulfuromonas sp. CSMB_57]
MQKGQEHRSGRLLLACCLVGGLGFFSSYLRLPIMPLLAASVGGSPAQVGLINAAFMLSAGLLSIPGGLLSDRFGRKRLIRGGLLLIAGSSLLITVCRNPLQMALVYLLFGTGLASFAPNLMSLVADVAAPRPLSQAYGWYTTAVYAAMATGPAVGGLLGKLLGLRPVFLLSGLLLLGLFGATGYLLPPSPASADPSALGGIRAGCARLAGNRRFVACLTLTLGACFGLGLFLTFLPLHARQQGLDSRQIGLVFGSQALVNTLARIPFGYLGRSLRRPLLWTAGGILLFAVGLAPLGRMNSFAAMLAGGCTLGAGMAIGFTLLGVLIAESVPGALRGLAMGMYNACIFLGMMLSAASMGMIVQRFGYDFGFIFGALVAVASALFFLHWGRAEDGGRS